MTELFTVNEAAERLRLCNASVYKMIRKGEIHPTRIGGRTLFTGAELERLINESTGVPA